MSYQMKRAKGTEDGKLKGVFVRFASKTFDEIAAEAHTHNVSFAQRVRDLCEKSLIKGDEDVSNTHD